jgi:hypothetical protein
MYTLANALTRRAVTRATYRFYADAVRARHILAPTVRSIDVTVMEVIPDGSLAQIDNQRRRAIWAAEENGLPFL